MSEAAATPAAPAPAATAPPKPPTVGQSAPFSPELSLPRAKPTLVVFLRQCGDPFAEKTFRDLATLSNHSPGLTCIAVSQGSRDITDEWILQIGGTWDVEVVADPKRDMYADWGLGLNTSWQMFNPRALYATFALGRNEGIWSPSWGGRDKTALPAAPKTEASAVSSASAASAASSAPAASSAESAATPASATAEPVAPTTGNKWQMGGAFAVDTMGVVRWAHVGTSSEDLPDYGPVLELFGLPPMPKKKKKVVSDLTDW